MSCVVEPCVCFLIVETQHADQLRQEVYQQKEKRLLVHTGKADVDFPARLIKSDLLSRLFLGLLSSSKQLLHQLNYQSILDSVYQPRPATLNS